jgi:hypothetical protein
LVNVHSTGTFKAFEVVEIFVVVDEKAESRVGVSLAVAVLIHAVKNSRTKAFPSQMLREVILSPPHFEPTSIPSRRQTRGKQ